MVEAKCGFQAKSEFGRKAHERNCVRCKGEVMPKPVAPVSEIPVDDGLVDVHVEIPININGHSYGGLVRVSPAMAQDLRYRQAMYRQRLLREQRSMVVDRKLMEMHG